MRAYTYSVHVDRTPEQVWSFLTDLSQAPRWRTMFRSMEVVGGGPLRMGAELRVAMEAMGKIAERTITTTAFDPPRRWVTRSASNGMSGDFEYLVAPEETGARVTATCDLHAHRFLALIFLPMIARQERRARVNQLEIFKRLCEGHSQSLAPTPSRQEGLSPQPFRGA